MGAGIASVIVLFVMLIVTYALTMMSNLTYAKPHISTEGGDSHRP